MVVRSVVTILSIFVLLPALAQKKSKSPKQQILFSVNNRTVPVDEFVYLYNKNHQHQPENYSRAKIDEYLNLFVNFKLKVEEARTRGYDNTETFLKEFNSYKEELRRPYLPEGKMLDSLVRMTYNRLKEEVKASHILINAAPDALPEDTLKAFNRVIEIKERILKGEDFGTLAASLSEDPSARTNRGSLGYFTAMQMVYPFESAAYSGKPGDVVGPVRTRFGYHLLKIEDRKPARGEVEVSHIMIRTGADRDENKSRDLIFEIYDQVKGGLSWEELCSQYSDDGNSKNNGGRLRPFGVGAMAAAPEFDAVAFSLQTPGEISDPFKTAFGWHIVRLERKIPLPTFEELSASLKGRVQRDERVQVSRKALLERLKKEMAFKENAEVKAKVFARADTSLTKGKWTLTEWPGNETIFNLKSGAVSAKRFVEYVNRQQQTSQNSPQQYAEQVYTTFVESVINQAYEEQLVRSNPDYEFLLREYYEGILLFDIMEREVWNKASEDSVGQRTYYEDNAGKYMAGERIAADLFSTSSPEPLEQIRQAIAASDTAAIDEIIKSRKARHETGLFQANDRPVLAKIARTEGLHTAENNGMYYLVRILKHVPPGPMTFEEARASVIADYQAYLEKKWIDELKKKYTVKINEKGKQHIYKKLVRS
ncbi:MAG: peptidylprolyl isomerase [Cyclobacteriaceae bacterium]|nr:peptidylprolyl isomerase [Cyclobacteriaceae bacterium]